MRPIKFRGYDTQDGVRETVTFTLEDLPAGTDDYELVDPDSIAQFIGVDKNGNEVYEDDKVIRVAGDEDFAAIRDGEIVLEQSRNLTLQN